MSKGSVSLWVRDVDFEPRPCNRGHPAGPKHPMRVRREAELDRCRAEAEDWGPRLLRALLAWLRGEFDVDESRLRARLYLHEGLDLGAAMRHWTEQLHIEADRFQKPYRAVVDSSIRSRKHAFGCATVVYSASSLHRRVMARIEAVTSLFDLPG